MLPIRVVKERPKDFSLRWELKMKLITLFCIVALAGLVQAAHTVAQESAQQIIDLSHSFDDQTIYWPTEDGFQLEGSAGFTDAALKRRRSDVLG